MIELTVPVEQIPFIRTIEGRKFHNGKWQFPDSVQKKLIELGLLPSDIKIEAQSEKQFDLSGFLYRHQKTICNKALNAGCFGIFSDTGTGKTLMGLEIAKNYNKINLLLRNWINAERTKYRIYFVIVLWQRQYCVSRSY